MTGSDEYFMQQAIKEAQKAYDEDEVPIGAVIVMQDKIIARGYNQVEKLNDSTAHAEIITLTSAYNFLGAKYLPGAILYVTIEPCLMCAGALYWSKLSKVVYGADDKKHGYKKYFSFSSNGETGNPFHPKTTIIGGVGRENSERLIKDFFKVRR